MTVADSSCAGIGHQHGGLSDYGTRVVVDVALFPASDRYVQGTQWRRHPGRRCRRKFGHDIGGPGARTGGMSPYRNTGVGANSDIRDLRCLPRDLVVHAGTEGSRTCAFRPWSKWLPAWTYADTGVPTRPDTHRQQCVLRPVRPCSIRALFASATVTHGYELEV